LLGGLEAVELQLSEVKSNDFKIDSESYFKNYLKIFSDIKQHNYTTLGKEVKLIKKGIFDINSNKYTESGVPFVRIKNLKGFIIDDTDIVYIPVEENLLNMGTFLSKWDIILSKTAYAVCSLVTLDNCNTSQDTVAIKLKDNSIFNSHFITIYFNTSYGLELMRMLFTGNIQTHLNLTAAKNILIPIFTKNFQSNIKDIFSAGIKKLEQSKVDYQQAETLLLTELDLLDFKPSTENIAVKSFSESFGNSGRLDSEYYQPKYDELIEKIKNYKNGFEKLNYFTDNYSTGYPFKSDTYVSKGMYLIRINNIKKGYLDISNASKIPYSDKNTSIKDVAKENDILISMSGTIGNSCKVPKGVEAIINQRIMKISPKNIGYDLLPLLINSIIGQSQLERIGAGGVQTNISSGDILNIIIPIIEQTIQNKIEEKIKASFQHKKQSKQLLDLAKQAVEIAIEENEDTAIKLIEAHEV